MKQEKIVTDKRERQVTIEKEYEKPIAISCKSMSGIKVTNREGDDLGEITDAMIDLKSGCIAYVVLSYGGLLTIKRKMFALPLGAFLIEDPAGFIERRERKFVLNLPKEALKESEGFDEDNWPETPDFDWLRRIYARYGFRSYWE